MFFSRETFFLGGGDDIAIAHQRGRAVMTSATQRPRPQERKGLPDTRGHRPTKAKKVANTNPKDRSDEPSAS